MEPSPSLTAMTTTATAIPTLTTFTPPSSCLTSSFQFSFNNTYTLAVGPSIDARECFPSPWSADASHFYSPATGCPSGYATASSTTVTTTGATETRVFCCLSGFDLFHGDSFESSTFGPLSCFSTGRVGPGASLTLTNPVFDNISGPYSTLVGMETFSIVSTKPALVQAFSVQFRYQASDLSSIVPPSNSGTANGSERVSGGAIAGIVFGALIGAALLVALVVLLLRRRRMNQRDAFISPEKHESSMSGDQASKWTGDHMVGEQIASEQMMGEQYYSGYKAELADTPRNPVYPPVEMEGSAAQSGGVNAQELDSIHLQSDSSWIPTNLGITSAAVGEETYGTHLSGEAIFPSHLGSSPQPSAPEFRSSLIPPSAPQTNYSPPTHYSPLPAPPILPPIVLPDEASSTAAGPSSIADYSRAQSRSNTRSQESVVAMQKRLQRVKEERQRLSQLQTLSQEEEELERELELRLASDNSP